MASSWEEPNCRCSERSRTDCLRELSDSRSCWVPCMPLRDDSLDAATRMTVYQSLLRLVPALSVAVGVIFATWPWLAGPAAVGVASFAGTALSNVIDDHLAERPFAWGLAFGQGAACGVASWLMLRWLTG